MVVDEKGLISAMKEAFKTTGYKVAVDETAGPLTISLTASTGLL